MTTHLLNSAMMPKPGTYHLQAISQDEFFRLFIDAMIGDGLINCIGYAQNLEMIAEQTGIRLKTSREQTHLEDGDNLLIMRLKYRTEGIKGGRVNPDDFEFFTCTYTA